MLKSQNKFLGWSSIPVPGPKASSVVFPHRLKPGLNEISQLEGWWPSQDHASFLKLCLYFEDCSRRVLTVLKIQNDSIIQRGLKPNGVFGMLRYTEYLSEFWFWRIILQVEMVSKCILSVFDISRFFASALGCLTLPDKERVFFNSLLFQLFRSFLFFERLVLSVHNL